MGHSATLGGFAYVLVKGDWVAGMAWWGGRRPTHPGVPGF